MQRNILYRFWGMTWRFLKDSLEPGTAAAGGLCCSHGMTPHGEDTAQHSVLRSEINKPLVL